MRRRHAHARPAVPEAAARACDRHGVHLIADEIAVGFGRTGTMFACEQAGISPDFMCLSKGLTAGYLPMSAVLTTDEVYEAFYDEYTRLNAFLHSHSYCGNPLACTAALASLDIFRDENILGQVQQISRALASGVARFADHPNVTDIRQCGSIVAIEYARPLHPRAVPLA
jgi:adenosylmethionine-8-amino-7-oxononanoate aminotransferase